VLGARERIEKYAHRQLEAYPVLAPITLGFGRIPLEALAQTKMLLRIGR
jgi:hypothetical protein